MGSTEIRVAIICTLLIGGLMLALHERHYRSRADVLDLAHLEGMELRLAACERILREDRRT